MSLINKLKTELDRAGRAAADALDEGKLRLEAFRARQLADKSAEALGYAVYRAKKSGADLDPTTFQRLFDALDAREMEVGALEARMKNEKEQGARSEEQATPPPPSGV
ncbi:MAG TPA: hypothetical protein VJ717_10240 [Gemmatimonadaceae bacterium]|nr:hypothetical protein [Gemmatimonadaceae bacterium]